MSDVLIGSVVFPSQSAGVSKPSSAEVVEAPDANTRLVWRTAAVGKFAGVPLLAAFEIVHAQARWELDRLSVLPAAVAECAVALITSAAPTYAGLSHTAERMRFRAETIELLEPELLQRDRHSLPRVAGQRSDAIAVARALLRLADGLTPTPPADNTSLSRTTVGHRRLLTFVALSRELASVLGDTSGPALPAPGTSAALRSVLRGGLPLGNAERQLLRRALLDIDEPQRWLDVSNTISNIAESVCRCEHS
jgi:hypothetical protein